MLARRKQRDELLTKLPEVLDIQKKKLIIAMEGPPNGEAEKFSAEQETLVKEVMKILENDFGVSLPSIAIVYSDITRYVNGALKRNAIFDLETYLRCAKNICIIFKEKNQSSLIALYEIMEYVLRHARQFTDPSKTIFEMDTQAATNKARLVDFPDEEQGSRELALVDRATALTEELHQAYNEEKFMALNALITSFTLVITRRFIKRRQHRAPIFCLIVHAYLTTDDEKTKKNLYDTCIKHMEWYHMHMPSLFFKVLDLYNIRADELWDALMSTKQMKHVEQRINLSLIMFAQAYYDMYQVQSPQQQQQLWFQFSLTLSNVMDRVILDQNGLSDEANVRICMVLHSLVEMASKKDHTVCNLDYTEPKYSDWAQETAAEIMAKITK